MKMMSIWAEKMMLKAHKAVQRYQSAMENQQTVSVAKRNMLYGRYLKDMDEAI